MVRVGILFFASKGLEVYAIDSSKVAIENLTAKAKKRNLTINLKKINAEEFEEIIVLDNYRI